MNPKKLRTVRQIAESSPAFTEASLRWLIYRSDVNGMDQVLVRVGRRVLLDTEKFDEWLEGKRQSQPRPGERSFTTSARKPGSYVDR